MRPGGVKTKPRNLPTILRKLQILSRRAAGLGAAETELPLSACERRGRRFSSVRWEELVQRAALVSRRAEHLERRDHLRAKVTHRRLELLELRLASRAHVFELSLELAVSGTCLLEHQLAFAASGFAELACGPCGSVEEQVSELVGVELPSDSGGCLLAGCGCRRRIVCGFVLVGLQLVLELCVVPPQAPYELVYGLRFEADQRTRQMVELGVAGAFLGCPRYCPRPLLVPKGRSYR